MSKKPAQSSSKSKATQQKPAQSKEKAPAKQHKSSSKPQAADVATPKQGKGNTAQTSSTSKRVTILGHSASSFLKWMGKQDGKYSMEQAKLVAASKLASGPLAASSISTAFSDGKNPTYNGNAADVSKEQAKTLDAFLKVMAQKAAAKGGAA